MKKLLGAYRVFTPDKFTIFGLGIGTVVFCLAGWLLGTHTIPFIALLVVAGIFSSFDIMCDFFVFQGIFAKDFNFGLLVNSYKGAGLLKMGVITDQLRRLIQTAIVLSVTGMIVYPGVVAGGNFTDPAGYAAFLATLILTVYTGNTITLNFSRKYSNYMEGILVIGLFTALDILLALGVIGIFTKNEAVDAWPLLLVLVSFAVVATYAMCERVSIRFKDTFGIRTVGRFGDDSKTRMIIFLAIAYGVDILMLPIMKYGYDRGVDLSVLLVAQMMYPACGVALAKLLSYNEGKLPKFSYILMLITGAVFMVLSALCVMVPSSLEVNGVNFELYYYFANFIAMASSVIMIIAIIASGKEKRENAGYRFKKPGKAILFMLLFFVLYFTLQIISILFTVIMGQAEMSIFADYFSSLFAPGMVSMWLNVLISLPLTFVIFLGEEYGWRYYLQPIMQKKFGVALGTVLLGIAWGVWHAGADFMYYSSETGIQMFIGQIIACISLAIYMGYAYMKTENIWVPVVIHYFNNNLAVLLSGKVGTEGLQGKVVTWDALPVYVIAYSVMWLFILTPTMRGKISKNSGEKEND